MKMLPTLENNQSMFGADVSELPRMVDLVDDERRHEPIRSMDNALHGIGADTSIADNAPAIGVYTVHEALTLTKTLLEDAITHPRLPEGIAEQAQDMYENISFIGEEELAQAAIAIALYWKSYLDQDESASIFVINSKTFEPDSTEDEAIGDEDNGLGHVSQNKSDSYILDKVLSYFSDNELWEYGDRLLLSASEFMDKGSNAGKAIILDDWIMSGQQINDILNAIPEHVLRAGLEVNLVVCNQDRLSAGLVHGDASMPIPVKAHFVSHKAKHSYATEFGGSYLTAAHSSGDYPFEGALENIVSGLNQVRNANDGTAYMPPLANIIRPYYESDYRFGHIERHASLRLVGRTALMDA